MPPTVEITISPDDEEFFSAVQDMDGILPVLADGMIQILEVYKEVASEYAPESEGNRPGRIDVEGHPIGFYERGRGWWYPVVTHGALNLARELPILGPHNRAPKTMGAMALLARKLEPAVGYKLTPNSEQMHDRWTTQVDLSQREVVGQLINTASYSDYVQGPGQIPLHDSRGWQTVEQTWQDQSVQSVVVKVTFDAITRYYHLRA